MCYIMHTIVDLTLFHRVFVPKRDKYIKMSVFEQIYHNFAWFTIHSKIKNDKKC